MFSERSSVGDILQQLGDYLFRERMYLRYLWGKMYKYLPCYTFVVGITFELHFVSVFDAMGNLLICDEFQYLIFF